MFSGAGLAFAATVGAIGFASIQVARRGIKKLGKSLLGLDEPSAEDKITEISKQHRREEAIAPEQVLGVYAVALPDLGASIKDQFGRKFDELEPQKQAEAVAAFDAQYGITSIASAISNDQMNVRELTFSAHGQISGVYPDPSLKEKLKGKAQDALEAGQDKLQDVRTGVAGKVDQIQDWRQQRHQSKLQDKVAKAIDEGRELPKEALEAAPESYWQATVQQQRAQKAAEQGQGPAK